MGDIPVATLRPSGSSVAVEYVHTDQLNTPRQVTRPADNAHTYAYVGDNPVSRIDSWGLKPGDSFPTRGAAAQDYINSISIGQNLEYAGLIYKDGLEKLGVAIRSAQWLGKGEPQPITTGREIPVVTVEAPEAGFTADPSDMLPGMPMYSFPL